MGAFVYFIAAGPAFFVGVAMLVAALVPVRPARNRWALRLRAAGALLGLALIAASGTPQPLWAYAVAIVLTAASWAAGALSRTRGRARIILRGTAAFVWSAMAVAEMPSHFVPAVRWPSEQRAEGSQRMLFVLGDSVSAGMEEPGETPWPRRLATKGTLDVRDFSQMGATAKSAWKQAERIDGPGLVLVEIGGNDVLGPDGGTQVEEFERHLDTLLEACGGSGRSVVMMELPLPPFGNRYGEIQRRLARRHAATLIPKRVFLRILCANGATLDGIHLSDEGHRLFAEMVSALAEPR